MHRTHHAIEARHHTDHRHQPHRQADPDRLDSHHGCPVGPLRDPTMIVGKGLLARAFASNFGANTGVIIFASGVSNSLETRESEFEREHTLLRQMLDCDARRFVYFSSCGVVTAEAELTPYMRHKRRMESLVLSKSHGLVFRLPQVVGRTDNSHTLTNFLRDHITSGEHFTVWAHAERNLIDIDDIARIGSKLVDELPAMPATISIAALESLPMPRIIQIFERVLGKTANCTYVDKGAPMPVDTVQAQKASAGLGIDLGGDYVERVIVKYYAVDTGRHAGHASRTRPALDAST